jgi:hypothetical protein
MLPYFVAQIYGLAGWLVFDIALPLVLWRNIDVFDIALPACSFVVVFGYS